MDQNHNHNFGDAEHRFTSYFGVHKRVPGVWLTNLGGFFLGTPNGAATPVPKVALPYYDTIIGWEAYGMVPSLGVPINSIDIHGQCLATKDTRGIFWSTWEALRLRNQSLEKQCLRCQWWHHDTKRSKREAITHHLPTNNGLLVAHFILFPGWEWVATVMPSPSTVISTTLILKKDHCIYNIYI